MIETVTLRLYRAFGLALLMSTAAASAQSQVSLRAPGDTSLHGNPSCARWPQIDAAQRETWMRAILVPLNFTFLTANKQAPDRLGALPGLQSGASFIDAYCKTAPNGIAAAGAIQFLEQLNGSR